MKQENPFNTKEIDSIVKDPIWNELGKEIKNVDEIVKFYPGSDKGPLPEDDPEAYSKWFVSNQPFKEIYGTDEPTLRDIGVQWQWLYTQKKVDDNATLNATMDPIAEFVRTKEMYMNQTYEGAPEWDAMDEESISPNSPTLPHIRYHSNIRDDQMLPIPEEHSLRHDEVHF